MKYLAQAFDQNGKRVCWAVRDTRANAMYAVRGAVRKDPCFVNVEIEFQVKELSMIDGATGKPIRSYARAVKMALDGRN